MKRMVAALCGAAALALAAASSAFGAPPEPVPGEPGCQGHLTALIAQQHKTLKVPAGFGPYVRFFGFEPKEAHEIIKEFCAEE